MTDERLDIIISAYNQAEKTLNQVKQQVQGIEKQINNSTKSINSNLSNQQSSWGNVTKGAGAFYIALQAFQGLSSAFDYSAELENTKVGLATLLGDAKKAEEALKKIEKSAVETPFDFTTLAKATQQITSITKDADIAQSMVLNLGKAIASSGGGSEQLKNIVFNIQQIGRTGKATEMDMRQFGTNLIDINGMIAKSMGISIQAVSKLQDEGKIGFNEITKAINDAGQSNMIFENSAKNWSFLFANSKEAITSFTAEVLNSSGVIDMLKNTMAGLIYTMNDILKPAIKSTTEYFKQHENQALALKVVIGTILVSQLVLLAYTMSISVVTAIRSLIASNLKLIASLISTSTTLYGRVIPAILSFVGALSLPVIAITALGVAVVALGVLIYKNWDKIVAYTKQKFMEWGNFVSDTFNRFYSVANQKIEETVTYITNKFNELVNMALQWGSNLINMFAQGISNSMARVNNSVTAVASSIKARLGFSSPTDEGPGKNADQWGPNLINMLADGILSGKSKIENVSNQIIGGFKNKITDTKKTTQEIIPTINSLSSSLSSIGRAGVNSGSQIVSSMSEIKSITQDTYEATKNKSNSIQNLYEKENEQMLKINGISADSIKTREDQFKKYTKSMTDNLTTEAGKQEQALEKIFKNIELLMNKNKLAMSEAQDMELRGVKKGSIPKMASGGVVNSPTIAMVGEAGPEAVVPLKSGSIPVMMNDTKRGGNTINITINGTNLNQDELLDVLTKKLNYAIAY